MFGKRGGSERCCWLLFVMGWCFRGKCKLHKVNVHLLLGFRVKGSITFKHLCALEDWL
jgi:hypothetical protein